MNKLIKGIPFVTIIVTFLTILLIFTTETAGAQELQRKQIYRIADTERGPEVDFNPFNPSSSIWLFDGGGNFWVVYEQLAYWDLYSNELKPLLAESWEWKDAYTLEVKIRPEAHFRDGTPVTAEDVVFSFNSQTDPEYGGAPSTIIESMEALGEKTVQINLNEDYPRNRQVYSFFTDIPIIPKSRWQWLLDEHGGNIVEATPNMNNPEDMNGSGPYTLEKITQDRVLLRRVDNYWGEKIGWYYLPEYVEHYWYGGNEAVVEAGYRNHEADWGQVGYNYPNFYKDRMDYMLTWDIDGPEEGMWWHEASMFVIVPNWGKEIFRETYPWLLKALNYATDDKTAMEAGFFGVSCPDPPTYLHPDLPNYDELVNEGVLHETYPELEVGYNGHLYIPYYPDMAVQILSEHCEGSVDEGWTYNGEELGGWTIQAVKDWTDVDALVREVAKDWSEVGIPTEPEFPEYGTWSSNWDSGSFDFTQVWCWNYLVGNPVANTFESSFTSLSIPDLSGYSGIWYGAGTYLYEKYFSGNYPSLENTAKEVDELSDVLYGMTPGTDEYISTVKEIQDIIVPQVPAVFTGTKNSCVSHVMDRWINKPNADDPYEHRQDATAPGFSIKHTYPRDVTTTAFSISPESIKAGETATAVVTLKNAADVDLRYAVYLRNGEAEPGPGPEVLNHTAVTVPAGGTTGVELDLSFDESGSYKITVDDWRIDDWDVGDPITKMLVVQAVENKVPKTEVYERTKIRLSAPPQKMVYENVSIEGQLVELIGGDGIESRNVTLTLGSNSWSETTGENGKFSIEHSFEEPDNYILKASFEEPGYYLPSENEVSIEIKPLKIFPDKENRLIRDHSTKLSGTTKSKEDIEIFLKDRLLGESKSGKKGNFSVRCEVPDNASLGPSYLKYTLPDFSYSTKQPVDVFAETTLEFRMEGETALPGENTGVIAKLQTKSESPIENAPLQFSYLDKEISSNTDGNGECDFTLSVPENEGGGEVHFRIMFQGQKYFLPCESEGIISIIPIIEISSDNRLVRGEANRISGCTNLGSERIEISLGGEVIKSLKSDEDGSFKTSVEVSPSENLGINYLSYALPQYPFVENQRVSINARTRTRFLENPEEVSRGEEYVLKGKVQEVGTKNPVDAAGVMFSFFQENRVAKTDNEGIASIKARVPENYRGENAKLSLSFPEQNYYLASRDSVVCKVASPSSFRNYILLAALASAFLVGTLILVKKRSGGKGMEEDAGEAPGAGQEAKAAVEEGGYTLHIGFPLIESPFPPVWSTDEPLRISFTVKEDGRQVESEVRVAIDGESVDKLKTGQDGVAELQREFEEKGTHRISSALGVEGVTAEREVRIVNYREEIISLFNFTFDNFREGGVDLYDETTPREFKRKVEDETGIEESVLNDLVGIFEIADYSLHDVGRDEYERFYLAYNEMDVEEEN